MRRRHGSSLSLFVLLAMLAMQVTVNARHESAPIAKTSPMDAPQKFNSAVSSSVASKKLLSGKP